MSATRKMKLVTVALATVLLSGCAIFGKTELVCEPYKMPQLSVPEIQKLEIEDVDWIVVTPENASTVFATLKKKGIDTALFAVTDDGYVTLSTNAEKVQGHIQQQRITIKEFQTFRQRVEEAAKATKKPSKVFKDTLKNPK